MAGTSGLPQFDSVRTYNIVEDFDAVGDGTTDNMPMLKAALRVSISEPIVLFVPAGNYYLRGADNERLELWPEVSKGIRLKGEDGAVFYPKNNRTNSKHEHWFMQLFFTTDNIGFEVDNIIVDGSRNPQDLYFTMAPGLSASDIPLPRSILAVLLRLQVTSVALTV